MKDSARLELPLRVFEDAAALFRLLSTPGRLRIVDALCAGEKDVMELLANTRVAQPELSEHLGLLSRAGLVLPRHVGGRLCYRLADDCAVLVRQAVGSMLAQGEDETGVGGTPFPGTSPKTRTVRKVEKVPA